MRRSGFLPLLVGGALCVSIGLGACYSDPGKGEDASQDRFDAAHPDAGLPANSQPLRVYSDLQEHPLNQLHHLLFVSEVQPAEINGALPRELLAGTDASKPWYFRRRVGNEGDRKLFGGDVRVSPIVNWESTQSLELERLYAHLRDGQEIGRLAPISRQLLQWDLLAVWWRLEQKEHIPQGDLWRLADLIRVATQSEAEIRSLPSGWDQAQKQFLKATDPTPHEGVPSEYFSSEDILDSQGNWTEISRRSTQLFVATQSLRNSRVFIKTDLDRNLQSWMESHKDSQARQDKRAEERIETAMVLSLIGITPDLKPIASPVIDEIRFRTVFGSKEFIDPSLSTTQDGSSIWVYFIDRQGTLNEGSPVYRNVPMTSQAIFLEYGTAKHATYAAQCSLCHRLTNAGNQTIAGVRALSISSGAAVEEDPAYRGRLAEAQMGVVVKRLEERLTTKEGSLPRCIVDFKDAIHTIPR